jgi:hypothetical protein
MQQELVRVNVPKGCPEQLICTSAGLDSYNSVMQLNEVIGPTRRRKRSISIPGGGDMTESWNVSGERPSLTTMPPTCPARRVQIRIVILEVAICALVFGNSKSLQSTSIASTLEHVR